MSHKHLLGARVCELFATRMIACDAVGMGWEALKCWGPDVERIEQFTDGVANEVWRVRLGDRVAVARLGGRSDADLQWEMELVRYLDGVGINVPLPIPTTDGRSCVDGLVVMTYIDGRPPASPDDWHRVAKTVRKVHDVTAGWPQRPGWRSSSDLVHATSGTRVDLTAMPDEGVARCRAAWARLDRANACVVHGDVGNVGNIRMTGKGVALLDWDESHVDDPALDLVLPHNAAGLDDESLAVASQASAAWEAAVCWDDDYSRRRLAEVEPVTGAN